MENTARFLGNGDFHDGFVRAVTRTGDRVVVTIEGSGGNRYTITFDGVSSVESHSPEDMMLYALAERDTAQESLRLYDFVNWYSDEPQTEKSKSHLRIVANRLTITESS